MSAIMAENRTFAEIEIGDTRDRLPWADQGRARRFRRRLRRLQPDAPERGVRARPRPAGAGRTRHVDGVADLQPAWQQAAGRRHGLSRARTCSFMRRCSWATRLRRPSPPPARRRTGELVRFDCRCTNQNGEVVLDRHGRGAARRRAGTRFRSSTGLPSASRPTTATKSCCAAPARIPAISLRRRLSLRRELPARRRRGGRGGPDRARSWSGRRRRSGSSPKSTGSILPAARWSTPATPTQAAAQGGRAGAGRQGRAADEGQPAHRRAARARWWRRRPGCAPRRRISHVFIMAVPTYPEPSVHHRRRGQHRA